MSKIVTRSRFFYGTTVTVSNRSIDFDEGGPELFANLRIGDYSLTEYAAEVQRALREAGSLEYLVTLNRTTQRLQFSAPATFTLRSQTGSRSTTAAWGMMGVTTTSNKLVASPYTGENIAGSRYDTQYPVDQYMAFEDSRVKESASVNVTPEGVVQQIVFGEGSRARMNIRLVTNKDLKCNEPFFYNPNGIANLKTFMDYLLAKGRAEFMADLATPAVFTKCYLEATEQDSNALRWDLSNMRTPDVYETGVLTFRKVLT